MNKNEIDTEKQSERVNAINPPSSQTMKTCWQQISFWVIFIIHYTRLNPKDNVEITLSQ